MQERLQKILSGAGVCSRRAAEKLMESGAVTVNGVTAKPGDRADAQVDDICVNGKRIGGHEELHTIMLYKPAGVVTTMSDEKNRRTVAQLVQRCPVRVLPVGRLDQYSEGLLLLTNDGELLHRLISPKKEVPKIYYARHEGTATLPDIQAFAAGLTLRDGTVCRPARLEPLGAGESLITVCEGKYHQVRRMMAARCMTVTYLERRQEGALKLNNLPRGAVRELTEAEISALET